MSGTVAAAFSQQGATKFIAKKSKQADFYEVIINSCTTDFEIKPNAEARPRRPSDFAFKAKSPDGIMLTWLMTPADWTQEDGIVYTGSTTYGKNMTMNAKWVIGNPSQAVGALEIILKGKGKRARGMPLAFLQSVEPDDVPTRYECRCRSHLEAWIDKQVNFSEKMRDAYDNPKYYSRPKGIPEDDPSYEYSNWNTAVYDGIIVAMTKGKMTYEQAVTSSIEKYFPNNVPLSEGEETKVAKGLYGAYTNNEFGKPRCKINYFDNHRRSCYPSLMHEQIAVHETVHHLLCKKRIKDAETVSSITGDSVEDILEGKELRADSMMEHGQEEVTAYNAQIEFLKEFIPKNCK